MSQSKTLSSARLASGLRLSLLVGTALTAWSVPALAQVAPPANTVPVNTANGGATITSPAPVLPADSANGFTRRYQVDMTGNSRILTFSSYDVASNVIVDYVTSVVPAGQITAVNNITAGNPSEIFGLIRSAPNIDVWLINPDGIAFGGSGSFSGASLLVSTLPWANLGIGNLATPQFTAPVAGAPTQLFLAPGSTIIAGGSTILISEALSMDGSINATGDVALIGTRNVTFTNVPGSPLNFSITEGVRVDISDVGVQVTGSITGANIGVAAGGRRTGAQLTANILDIDPGATLTATAANGSIILATATESGMTITNTPAASETIISEGALSATGVGGDVIVRSAEGISMAGGSVAANGGDVTLRTTAGQISANGGFAISGQNVLINSPSTITFNASTSIGTAGTPVNNVEVVATGAVTLGDVFANSLVSQGLGVLTETQLTLGNIRTTQALDVSTTAGALTFASLESTTGSVTVNSNAGNVVGGDIDAATSVEVDGAQIGLGTVNAVTDIDADAAAGSLTFAALNTTTGNVTGTATGAILGNGNVAATAGTVALTGTSLDVGAIAGTQVDLLANGAGGDIAFASINAGAGAGTVTLDANDGEIVGDVGNGDITGGAVFLAAGAGGNSNDISVGDVVASSLANTILGPELAAPNLTLGNVTVDTALTLIASDGDLNAGTIRTNGTNIALTAFDSGGGNAQGDVLIAGAITSLAGPALTGSIGIYAEGDVGVNIGGSGPPPPGTPIPEGVAILEAGEDIFVLSDDGNIFLDSVTAGDDIVLTALDNSEGRVSFESALTTGQNVDVGIVVAGVAPGAANSIVFTAPESVALTGSNTVVNADKQFVGSVSTVNFVENTLGDPAVYKGDIIATGFIQISAPSIVLGKNNEAHTFSAGDFIDISATTGNLSYAGDVTLISNTNPVVNGPGPLFDGIRLTAAGAIAGIDANDTIALQAGTAGNLQPVFVQAGTSAAITSASGLFLDFDAQSITLGMAGDTNAFTADETITIDTSVGDLLFAGDVTLTSNADGVVGVGLDGITLTVAGNIAPVAGGSASLLGGVPGSRTAVRIALGGDLAVTTVNASSLSVTNLLASFAPGDITIGNVTTQQQLLLRSSGGSINVDVASVTDPFAALVLAAGGGNDVVSGTSLTTNGGAILLSAADDVDVNLVDNGGGAAIGIASGGDTLIGSGIVSGDDIVIQAGGNVGAPGALVDLSAGDDIRVNATGTIFLDSAVTDGTGSDGLQLTIVNGGTENVGGFFPVETFLGSQIVLSAANLLGAPLTGSVEDALVVRDLLAGSANLSATLGEIRLGTVTANAGNLDVVATAGSVSGLANGSTNLAGGSTITAPGNITLTITGNAEIGVLDGAIVSGTSFDRLTVTTLRADAATLTAVNRLQVDSGTVTNAALFTTTGGLATNPSLIASPPIAGFGRADLSAQGLLSVSALSGAAQLGPIDSNAVGAAITVSAEAVDITSATTTNAGGNIALTATVGQLTVGTATSLGALALDKLGLTGQITATGPLEAVNNLDIDSATDITATTLRSTLGDIILESTGDTDFTTALADAGSFTATTTLGSGGDLTADRIRAQGAVVIDADGAITLDGDPDVSAILGFTRSIQSAGGAVSLTSGADTSVFSVEAAGAVTVDAGTNLRFDSVTGTVVTLDAGDDMSGLTGAGAGPLPGFGRGDVSGSTITIGALGTTGVVQLGLLAATGAATVTADQIDIATIDAATIGLTSTLAGVALGEGDASGNITVVAATSALITDANSTGGDIAATANGGSVTLTTGAAAPLGGDITLLATGDVNGVTLTGGGVLDVTAGVDAVLTSAVMGGAIDVDAGANVRLGTLTGTVVTLDAGSDISGLAGAGLGTDPLPAFLRGDVNGTTITIGALGTTGIVQLDTLDASGAVTVNADRINISTIDAASIDLTSTLADVVLGEGDASGNITVVAATNALVTDANSTGGNIAVTANGGDVTLITGTAAPLGGDITLVATGNATGGTLAGGGVLDVTAGVDAVLTSAVMGGAIDVDAGANVRLGALTGTAVTLDAVNDISGLVGVGAVSDPLPAFLRGDVTGTSITIGGAGTTNVVQLDALTGTGAGAAITLSAEAVDVTSVTSTAAGGNIALTATLGQLTLGTASSQGALTLDKLGATGGITANGPLQSVNDLDIDSATNITATTLRSTLGDIILESTGDTDFSTALVDAGSFTAVTTAGSGGDLTADRIRAQGTVLILADGAMTLDGNPAIPAIPGFTRSIQSVGGAVSLTSGADTSVFSVEAAGVVGVNAGTNLRFDSVAGTNISLDAGGDISGLAGAGAGTDPLPAFLRGNVTGNTINVGTPGITGIVQLGLLDATGAVIVNADQIDISTVDANTINLTSAVGSVVLGQGDATGGITVIAETDAIITDAASTGGDITVTANNGSVTLVTGAAAPVGGNILLMGSVNVNGGTLTGGGNLLADAGANVVLGSATMGGTANIAAGADAILNTVQMGSDIDVDAGANIRLGTLTGGLVTLDAGNDISGLAGAGAATDPLPAFLRGDVNGTTITIGAAGTTDVVQLDTLDAAASVTVTAGRVDISTADAGTFIDLNATDGSLALGSGTAGTTIDLDKTGTNGSLSAGTLLAGGNVTADSTTSLLLANVTSTGGTLVANATGVAGNGDAIVTLADTSGTILITSTNATAGGGTLDGSGITVNGVSVNVTTLANAGTGGIAATANGGDLFVATGTSGGDITLIKTGDTDPAQGITANALTAVGDIDLLSDTFVDVGNSSAGGFLNITSPDTIDADLLDSDGGIAINTGGDANLGAITSGGTIVVLAAGNIDADTLTAVEDIAARAGGGIAVGDFTAGDNVTFTAGTALDLGGGSTTGSGADNATYVLDLAQAGDTSVTSTAITDGPADAVNGSVLLAAPDNFNLTGAIDVAAANGTIIVRNLAGGSATTSVGTTGGFEISNAELGFLSADTVVIDSGAKALALGTFTVPGQSLQLLSSSAITLSGAITGTGTGTLQIGQGTIGADGLVVPGSLTSTITATTETASIDYAGGVVDLRAVRIVFGNGAFLTATQGITPEAAGELLTNAGSLLYIGDNSQRVFMRADTLRVAYSDFALFQNTAFSQGGGAILNADAANSIDSLALELFSQGDDNLDSFAIFGTINGFIGRTAGVLPNAVLNIGTLSPRNLRVTQSRSRVNGCVIGSPDRGCLIIDLPPPEINTLDERQAQSLISTDDPSEFLNPLVGRGNEGLILDIAQIPVGIDMLECAADDPTCQPTETVE